MRSESIKAVLAVGVVCSLCGHEAMSGGWNRKYVMGFVTGWAASFVCTKSKLPFWVNEAVFALRFMGSNLALLACLKKRGETEEFMSFCSNAAVAGDSSFAVPDMHMLLRYWGFTTIFLHGWHFGELQFGKGGRYFGSGAASVLFIVSSRTEAVMYTMKFMQDTGSFKNALTLNQDGNQLANRFLQHLREADVSVETSVALLGGLENAIQLSAWRRMAPVICLAGARSICKQFLCSGGEAIYLLDLSSSLFLEQWFGDDDPTFAQRFSYYVKTFNIVWTKAGGKLLAKTGTIFDKHWNRWLGPDRWHLDWNRKWKSSYVTIQFIWMVYAAFKDRKHQLRNPVIQSSAAVVQEDEPQVENRFMPTPGCNRHLEGTCIPCVYLSKGVCENGFNCRFCHMPH